MDNQSMTDRHNRTMYIRDFLFQKADIFGKQPDVDRSVSRIFEQALVEYLQKRGVDMSDDPMRGQVPDSE